MARCDLMLVRDPEFGILKGYFFEIFWKKVKEKTGAYDQPLCVYLPIYKGGLIRYLYVFLLLCVLCIAGSTNTKNQDCWCANGGSCEYHNHIYGHWPHGSGHGPTMASCRCRKGYTGKHCEMALCRPGCANGGRCVDPDVCACPDGYTGARCQTGIPSVFTC